MPRLLRPTLSVLALSLLARVAPAAAPPTKPAAPPTDRAGTDRAGTDRNDTERLVPDKAVTDALARLEAAPRDAERLRALLNQSGSVGGVSGLVQLAQAAADRSKGEAAQVVLGVLLREAGRCSEALPILQPAADGGSVDALVARARCELDSNNADDAFRSLETASSKSRGATRLEVLDLLLDAALDAERAEVVERAVAALNDAAPRDTSRAVSVAERLEAAGRLDAALTAWERLAQPGNDPRVNLLATTRMSRLATRVGDSARAISALEAALDRLPNEHPAEPELREALIDAYRQAGREDEYIAALEAKKRSYPETLVLARLLEESGQDPKALDAWRAALAQRPRNTDAQDAVIRIVTRIGGDADVEAELRKLAKLTPGDPRTQLELAAHLFRTGKGAQATKLLTELTARASADADTLIEIGELLLRVDGPINMVERVYETLLRLEPNEEGHVIAYGEVWYAKGDVPKAMAVWERIPKAMTNAARAELVLARLYADHDLMTEADAHYQRAVELAPTKASTVRSYALFLERAKRPADAAAVWEKVHALIEPSDAEGRREARRRVVTRLQEAGALDARISGWRTSDSATARLFTAEALLAQRKLDEAAQALEGVKGDLEALLILDELYERRNQSEKSLAVLEDLVRLDPARAAPRLERMAELALGLGHAEEAERYAARRVDLSPGDARALASLGDVQLARGRSELALATWRRSLAADPSPVPLRFKVVRLLDLLGRTRELELALIEIVERASDTADIVQASRQLASLAGPAGLGRLQSVLVRLMGQDPKKRPVYRELLLDLYAALAGQLDRARRSEAQAGAAGEAVGRLQRLGEQAIQPILDALSGRNATARQRVLRLITLTRPAAAGQLLTRLLADKDRVVVVEALIALAHVGVGFGGRPQLQSLIGALPALTGLATARDGGLSSLAIWALGTQTDPQTGKLLAQLVTGRDGRPERGFVTALALGARGRADGLETALELLRSGDVTVRPAAAWALGALGEPRAAATLADRLGSETGAAQAAIAWALGALRAPEGLGPILRTGWADASDTATLRNAARAIVAPGPLDRDALRGRLLEKWLDVADPAEGRIVVERAFPALLVPLPAETPTGLGRHSDAVRAALLEALQAPGPVAQQTALAGLLGVDQGASSGAAEPRGGRGLVLGPLLPELVVPDAWLPAIDGAVARLAREAQPGGQYLALQVLGRTRGPGGQRAIEAALAGPDAEGAVTAAEALVERRDPTAVAAVVGALRGAAGETWLHRVRLVRALGRLAAPLDSSAQAALLGAARDPVAALRTAAIETLAIRSARGDAASPAVTGAARAALVDSDPLTIVAGLGLAQQLGLDTSAERGALARHPSALVRRALAPQ